MTPSIALRLLIGKSLVAIGLVGAIALAIAAPLAFSVQIASPLTLLGLAACGALVSFALVKVGDFVADHRPKESGRGPVRGLPKVRNARDRRVRAATPAHAPKLRANAGSLS